MSTLNIGNSYSRCIRFGLAPKFVNSMPTSSRIVTIIVVAILGRRSMT